MRLLGFAAGTVVLTAVIVYLTALTAALLRERALPFNPLLHPAENAFRLLLIGAGVGLIGISGLPAEQFGLLPVPAWADIAVALGSGVAGAWAINGVSKVAVKDLSPGWYSKNALQSLRPRSAGQLVAVCLAALPAALLEELLFRAMWVGGFSTWFPPGIMVLLSALLFGSVHVAQGRWGVLMASAMGVVLGLLFLVTGNLWFVVAAHWAMNVNQFVVAYRWPAFFGLESEDGRG